MTNNWLETDTSILVRNKQCIGILKRFKFLFQTLKEFTLLKMFEMVEQ
jgi:hypothetical protein